MKFDKLQVGATLYNVQKVGVGNTTIKTLSVYTSKVVEIDAEQRRALISWNTNPARWYSERNVEKTFKAIKPILIKTHFGYRRPTREELAEIKAKAKEQKPEGAKP